MEIEQNEDHWIKYNIVDGSDPTESMLQSSSIIFKTKHSIYPTTSSL